MRFTRLLSGAALAAMLATTAVAQPAAPSNEKIALAKQLVEVSGGGDQMKAMVQVMFRAMGTSLSNNTPPEQKHLIEIIMQKMQDRFIAATPQMIDGTVRIYAQNLTDKELRDYLAWMQSDTGQALKRKAPLIAAESMKAMAPLIAQITQGLKQDVLDEACKQANCTPHDREVLAAAMDKAMPKRPG